MDLQLINLQNQDNKHPVLLHVLTPTTVIDKGVLRALHHLSKVLMFLFSESANFAAIYMFLVLLIE